MDYDQTEIIEALRKYIKPNKISHRIECPIEQTDRFHLPPKNKDLKAQYSNIYFYRLQKLQPRLKCLHQTQYQLIEKLQQIQKQLGTIQMIGTIFKEMKLKPYYFAKTSGLAKDASGRIKLLITQCKLILPNQTEMDIGVSDLLTGMVVMVEGQISNSNIVSVNKIYLPEMKQPSIIQNPNPDMYLCLISGLNYSSIQNQTKYKYLVQFLQGSLFSHCDLVSKISQILIVGNLYSKQQDCFSGAIKQTQDFKNVYANLQKDIQGLDELISTLSKITSVLIMPGENEPVSQMLPQTPINKCHFQQALKNEGQLYFLPNPTEFKIGNMTILGTSGQNIQDIYKYTNIGDKSNIDVVEMTLLYGHLAPTLPDTLECFPFTSKDPFVVNELPNLYFVGNMKEYGTKLVAQNVRIVSIPSYSETGQICVVNLNNLKCELINLVIN